ncbi:MAG TPA: hypothetical protein PL033_13690 [Candidatus Brocadiia bacterium]|nr:hypothetical protein [Candidatus Brocadiia bacterium]
MEGSLGNIASAVSRVAAARTRRALSAGAAGVVLLLAGGYVLVSALDIALKLHVGVRAIAFGASAGLLVIVAGSALRAARRASGKLLDAAGIIERSHPEIETTISTALEFGLDAAKTSSQSSPAIIEALAREAERRSAHLDLRKAVRWRKVALLALAAFACIASGTGYWIAYPYLAQRTFLRFFAPWLPTPEPTLTLVDVTPGNAEVPRLRNFEVKARLGGARIPGKAEILYAFGPDDGKTVWQRDVMSAGESGGVKFVFHRLAEDARYRVAAGDCLTPVFTASVFEEPNVVRMEIELRYPAYTRTPPTVDADALGPIKAIRGTEVRLTARCNNPLRSAEIEFSAKGIRLPGQVEGNKAAFNFTVMDTDRYRIRLTDARGKQNSESPDYAIEALEDRLPVVKLTRPGRNLKVTKTAEIPMSVTAEDDFGVTETGIVYKLKTFDENRMPFKQFAELVKSATERKDFYLEGMELADTDVITYWAYAYDNDTVSGPKEGTSELYFIEIRPYGEQFKEAPESASMPGMENNDLVAKLDDIIELQKGIIRDTFSLDKQWKLEPVYQKHRSGLQHLATRQSALGRNTNALASKLAYGLMRNKLTEHLDRLQHIEAAFNEMIMAAYWLEPEDAAQISAARALDKENTALYHLYRAKRDLIHLISKAKSPEESKQLSQALQQALDMARQFDQQQERSKTSELKKRAEELEKLKQEQSEINRDLREMAVEKLREQRGDQQQQNQQQNDQAKAQQQPQPSQQQSQQQSQQVQQSQQQSQQSQQQANAQAGAQQQSENQQQPSAQTQAQETPSVAQRQQNAAEKAKSLYQQLHALSQIDPSAPIEPLRQIENAYAEMKEAEKFARENAPDEARDRGKKAEDRLRDASRELQRQMEKDLAQRLKGMADKASRMASDQKDLAEKTRQQAEAKPQQSQSREPQAQNQAPGEAQAAQKQEGAPHAQPPQGANAAQQAGSEKTATAASQSGGEQVKSDGKPGTQKAAGEQSPPQGAEQSDAKDALTKSQQGLARDLEGIKTELQDVTPKAAEAAPEIGKKLEEIRNDVSAKGTGRDMENAERAIQENRPADAVPAQEKAAKDMEQIAGDLRAASDAFRMSDSEKLAKAAEKASELTRRQKELNREYDAARDAAAREDQKPMSGDKAAELTARQEEVRKGTEELGKQASKIRAAQDSGLAERLKESLDQAQAEMEAARKSAPIRPDLSAQSGREADRKLEAAAESLKDLMGDSINRQLSEALSRAQEARRAQDEALRKMSEAAQGAAQSAQQSAAQPSADGKAESRAQALSRQAGSAQGEAAELTKQTLEELKTARDQAKTADPQTGERVESARKQLEDTKTLDKMDAAKKSLQEGRPSEAGQPAKSARADLAATERSLEGLLEDRTSPPMSRLKRLKDEAEQISKSAKALAEETARKTESADAEKGKAAPQGADAPGDAESAKSAQEGIPQEKPADAREKLDELVRRADALQERLSAGDIKEEHRERMRKAQTALREAQSQMGSGQPSEASPGLNSASEAISSVAEGLVEEMQKLVERRDKRSGIVETPPEDYRGSIEKYYKALSDAK